MPCFLDSLYYCFLDPLCPRCNHPVFLSIRRFHWLIDCLPPCFFDALIAWFLACSALCFFDSVMPRQRLCEILAAGPFARQPDKSERSVRLSKKNNKKNDTCARAACEGRVAMARGEQGGDAVVSLLEQMLHARTGSRMTNRLTNPTGTHARDKSHRHAQNADRDQATHRERMRLEEHINTQHIRTHTQTRTSTHTNRGLVKITVVIARHHLTC